MPRCVLNPDLNESKDDFIDVLRHIRKADVNLDGQTGRHERTSRLTRIDTLDIRNSKELNLHRRIQGLQRTLKVKTYTGPAVNTQGKDIYRACS